MMQAIPLLFQGAQGVATALSVASGVIEAVGQYSAGMYQAKVAANNARIADENAKRAIHTANVQAQNQDFDALVAMGGLLAELGASGLQVGTGSAALRRKSQSELAARDRGYTIHEGQMQASNYRQQAQDFRTEAAGAKRGAMYSLLGGGLEVGSSLITGASKVNQAKAKRIAAGVY